MNTELLKELFDYSEGNLIWRVNKGRSKKGSIAGSKDSKGYLQVKLNQKPYRLHRLIWLWHEKELPEQIDHIDRNPLNNKIENLREATVLENSWNHKKRKRRIDLPMGVRNMANGKFQARISYKGKQLHLGVFETPSEAKAIYETKRKELYGKFA